MPTITPVRGLGSVPAAYRHGPKLATPREELRLPGARLKWYDVAPADGPVDPALHDEARAFLLAESDAGRLAFDDELGFVLLHRCGATFHFLLVQTWRGCNEVWETVYQRDGGAFEPRPPQGAHAATFCVWELGAIVYERDAWTRFLESARDEAAVEAYVADLYSGAV